MLPARIFHPWLSELALVAINRARQALRRWPESLFVLGAWSALAAAALYGLRYVDGDSLGVFIDALTNTPLITGTALATLGFLATRVTAVRVRRRLGFGWWGAMPVPQAATERTVVLCALLALLVALALVLLPIYGVASIAALWQYWLPQAVRLVWMTIPLGALLGYFAARGLLADRGESERRYAYGKPLFALAALPGNELPQLAVWQRTAAMRRWRSGGRAWLLGFLALALPNQAGLSLIGLVLLAIVLVWFGLLVQTAADVVVASAALLRATPIGFAPFARASFRYSAFAVLFAAVWGGFALLLQGAGWKFMLVLLLMFAAYATLHLALGLRFRAAPRWIRVRLAIDAVLLIATAQALGPAVLVLYAALLGRHLFLAQRSA